MGSKQTNSKKKTRSLNDLVEVMQPTAEELEYRKEKSKEPDFVQKYAKLFKCTKCQLNLKPVIVSQDKMPIHPCLGVLMCQDCCNYYEDGEFSLDSDDEDKYCRWCGEGGTIFSCSKCICGFCAACIKKHFKLDYFKKVQKDENWLCFFCDPKPLWDQRFICSLALKLSENVDSQKLSKTNKEVSNCNNVKNEEGDVEIHSLKTNARNSKRKRSYESRKRKTQENISSTLLSNSSSNSVPKSSKKYKKGKICLSSSEDSDLEIPLKRVKYTSTPKNARSEESSHSENSKSEVLSELKKILLLTEQQMDFGMNWSRNTVKKLKPQNIQTHKELLKECQKVKWFLSILSTYLVVYSNSVDVIVKKLHKRAESKSQQEVPDKEQSDYTKILQFLGFIRNQVKTFIDKGISFSDVLEAEVYDDTNFIGIRKKQSSTNEYCSQENNIIPVTSCNIKNYTTEKPECSEEAKAIEWDKGRDELLNLIAEESFEKDNEIEDENKGEDDSSSTILDELNDLKTVDPREDIRQILAILENA